MDDLILRRASVAPGIHADLHLRDGVIVRATAIGDPVADRDLRADEVHLDGRAVLPGLADHHLHLFGLAASFESVDLSPTALHAGGGLIEVLRTHRRIQPTGWIRGVDYDVAASGPLHRTHLDAAAVGSVRVQDRTGILWMLSSEALRSILPPDPSDWPQGLEADHDGPTGTFRRSDGWLRSRVPASDLTLHAVGRRLAARGVTAVTDAGADNDAASMQVLADAGLPQRLMVMTRDPHEVAPPGVELGPVKILLDDHDLPTLDELAARVTSAHAVGRPVAVHCVTAVQLVLALVAGLGPGDRIEHASLVPDDVIDLLRGASPTVVTQPGLLRSRGDRYLSDVEPDEIDQLYRVASLVDRGIRVALSSDAPYGPWDPWTTVAAAVERRTEAGRVLNPIESVTAVAAVEMLTGSQTDPGVPRRLVEGAVADLVVLDGDWDGVTTDPVVTTTVVGGSPIFGQWPG